MTNIDNSIMDWNDVIEDDEQEYVLLPEGDYNFVVTNFERGKFPRSAKIPATNKETRHLQELCVKAHNHVIDAITYLFLPVHEQEERRVSTLSSSAEGCSSLHPTYR